MDPAVEITRRSWLALAAASLCGRASAAPRRHPSTLEAAPRPPVRPITTGPRHHWFGYYDKLQFDRENRYVLSNEVDFEHRTPTAEDKITVGMVDTGDSDRWIPLGESLAWGWQQGSMLQWRPGSDREVIWNDREGDRFVCRILDVRTRKRRTVSRPVYAIDPSGRWAVSADFARIQKMRPGYGYQGIPDPCADARAPRDSGIWRVDLDTGESELIVSLAEVATIPHEGTPVTEHWNYFNHLLVSPDGERFIFLHRWRRALASGRATGGFITRMFTARMDGSDLYVLDPSGHTSHFIWRDPRHVCAWTKPRGKKAGFYLFEDKTARVEPVGDGVMTRNGHNTYLPGHDGEWILNDTYPEGPERLQALYLFHVPSGARINLGRFHLPEAYTGEWRCDLHPRSSNDGLTVSIDSPHGGGGRQVWLVDIREALKRA